MSDVTDADRERARAAIKAASPEVYVDEYVIDGELPPLIETIAAALAEQRAKARAPFLAEMVPTRWWRVVAADGSLWCETSDEEESRAAMRPGDKIQRLYELSVTEWRAAEENR